MNCKLQCHLIVWSFTLCRFGSGVGRIWLDDVNCRGNESHLVSCSNIGIGSHNCIHLEDVAIYCSTGKLIVPTNLVLKIWVENIANCDHSQDVAVCCSTGGKKLSHLVISIMVPAKVDLWAGIYSRRENCDNDEEIMMCQRSSINNYWQKRFHYRVSFSLVGQCRILSLISTDGRNSGGHLC